MRGWGREGRGEGEGCQYHMHGGPLPFQVLEFERGKRRYCGREGRVDTREGGREKKQRKEKKE